VQVSLSVLERIAAFILLKNEVLKMKTNKITKAITIMITTLLLILPFTSVSAFDSLQETDNKAEFEPGAVIVSLKFDSPSVTSLLSGFDIVEARLITPGSSTQNVYLVRFKEKTKEIVWRAIEDLKKSPYVVTAEPDYYQYVDDEVEDIITDNPPSNPTTSTQPTTSAADTTQATDNKAEFEPGAVIVSLKSNSPSVTSLLNGFEIEEERLITPSSDTQNVYLVRFTEKTKEIVWRAINVLKNSPYVITAETDYYQYIDDEIEETTNDNNSTEPTEPSTDKPTEPVTTEPTESSSETLPKPSDPVPTETEPNPTEPSETATELISVDPMPPLEAVGKVGEYIFGYYDAECYELNQTCEIGAYTFFVDGSFYQYCGITDGKKFTPLVIAYEKGLINDEQLDKTVELMNLRIKEKGYFNTAGWTVMPTEPVTTEPVTTEPTETITDKPTEPVTTEPIVINPQPTENKPTTPTVVKPTVKKKANPINVTVKTKTIKAKKLKKKTQEVKVITVKNNQGKVTYKLVKSGITKKIRKLVSINKKGAITIKKWKKAKVGTYKIKVRITAKGNSKYKPKTLIKTVKIKIK
jgi:hypothetical protein